MLAQGITRGMPRPVKSMAPAVNEYNAPYNPAAYEPTSIVPSALPIAPYRSSLNAHNRYDGTIFGGSGGVVRHGANGRVYTSVLKARRVTDIDVGHTVTVSNGKVHAGANGKVVAARNGYLIVQLSTGVSAYFRARDLVKTGGKSEPRESMPLVHPLKMPQRRGELRRPAAPAGAPEAAAGAPEAASAATAGNVSHGATTCRRRRSRRRRRTSMCTSAPSRCHARSSPSLSRQSSRSWRSCRRSARWPSIHL